MATPVFKRDGSGQLNGSIGDGRDEVPVPAHSVHLGQVGSDLPAASLADALAVLQDVSPTLVRVVDVHDRGKGDFTRCAHCGTGIRFEAHVELSDGSHAVWGTSCAGLSDNDRDSALTRRHTRASQKAIADWIATQPVLSAALTAYDAYLDHVDALVAQMEADDVPKGVRELVVERVSLPAPIEAAVLSVRGYGPDVWEKHIAVLETAHGDGTLTARPGVGELPHHVGGLGDKLCVEVIIQRLVILQPYCYGASSPALVIAHDTTGNPVLTKTTSSWAYHVQPGQHMTWTGTVKEHSKRFDVPQTWLTRVKAQETEHPSLTCS